MSGSAALASARRRRAIPASKIENTIIDEPKPQAQAMNPIHPGALLMKHNQMLSLLQTDLGTLKTQLTNIKVDPEPTNPEHLDYFKSQYATLLEEMKEIKKTLLKVQTFSMETNLEVMKLKRMIKIEAEYVPEITIKIE